MIRQLLANFRSSGPILFAVLGVATAAIALWAVWRDSERGERFWQAFWRLELPLLACWSVAAIVAVGLRPGEGALKTDAIALMPFASLRGLQAGGLSLVLGNILLFVPAGFFVTLWKPAIAWWKILLAAGALSVLIEFAQATVIGERAAQTDDVLMNMMGAAAGIAIARGIILWRRGDSNP